MRMSAYLATVACALAASGCQGGQPPEAQAVPPELRLEGVRFRVYRADALRAMGVADAASLRRDSSEIHAQKLDATLPRDAGDVRISAPTGGGSLLTRVFDAAGGVVVSRAEDVARTESARYEPDGDRGMVRGDDPIVVQGRGYRLEGTGFTLDPAEATIDVRGRARLLAGLPEAP